MNFQSYAESCKHRESIRCKLKVGSWPVDCRESACPTFCEYRRGLREGFVEGVKGVKFVTQWPSVHKWAKRVAARRWPERDGDE